MYIIDGIAYADDPSPSIRVTGVRAMAGHRLWLRFNTNAVKIFDFTPLLSEPAFTPLHDPAIFHDVYLDCGVVSWKNGEIDISSEYLYENAADVAQEAAG